VSAREVIRLFDALSEAERRQVADHILHTEKPETSPVASHASIEQVKQVAERVFTTNEELFRKLAQ
jgi:hypothetical protein